MKLKINDLEVGKVYKGFFKDKKQEGIYKINNDNKLFWNYKDGWQESNIHYNLVTNTYFHFEEIKREINWDKVPRGTKVQVRDFNNTKWGDAYFIYFRKNSYRVSNYLDDDYTGFVMENKSSYWEQCRIHPFIAIPEEWYKKEE